LNTFTTQQQIFAEAKQFIDVFTRVHQTSQQQPYPGTYQHS